MTTTSTTPPRGASAPWRPSRAYDQGHAVAQASAYLVELLVALEAVDYFTGSSEMMSIDGGAAIVQAAVALGARIREAAHDEGLVRQTADDQLVPGRLLEEAVARLTAEGLRGA